MSNMETNQGKLIPYRGEFITEDMIDDPYEYDLMRINDKFYHITWTVKAQSNEEGFAFVTENADGSIDFHTFHYNGGGCVSEVIQDEINSIQRKR